MLRSRSRKPFFPFRLLKIRNKYFNTPKFPPTQTVLSDFKQDCASILNWFGGQERVPEALWGGLTVCECIQRRCPTSAPGEPEIPQSADQPDAGGRGRTVQKHRGEFTTIRPFIGSPDLFDEFCLFHKNIVLFFSGIDFFCDLCFVFFLFPSFKDQDWSWTKYETLSTKLKKRNA